MPVRSFPGNGYGLYQMAGNVWEWTTDYFQPVHEVANGCCPHTQSDGPETWRRRSSGPDDGNASCKGRLVPLLKQLLPPVPAGGPPRRDRRYIDVPYWVPLHRPGRLSETRIRRRHTPTLGWECGHPPPIHDPRRGHPDMCESHSAEFVTSWNQNGESEPKVRAARGVLTEHGSDGPRDSPFAKRRLELLNNRLGQRSAISRSSFTRSLG